MIALPASPVKPQRARDAFSPADAELVSRDLIGVDAKQGKRAAQRFVMVDPIRPIDALQHPFVEIPLRRLSHIRDIAP
jgi:hypothetical protein